jgi:hypothetical protein
MSKRQTLARNVVALIANSRDAIIVALFDWFLLGTTDGVITDASTPAQMWRQFRKDSGLKVAADPSFFRRVRREFEENVGKIKVKKAKGAKKPNASATVAEVVKYCEGMSIARLEKVIERLRATVRDLKKAEK